MTRESKLLKNTAIIGFGTMCTKGISFLLLPLYTSILSTEEYGTVDLVNTIITLITYTLSIQFEQGIFRFLIDCRTDEIKKKKYISTALLTVTVTLVAGIAITIPITHIAHFGYTKYLIFNIIATLYGSIICQIVRGLGNIGIYTLISFLAASSQIAFNVIFIAGFNWHIEGMLTATIIGNVIATAVGFFSCRLYKYISLKHFDKENLNELLKYSLPMVPNTLCWWLVNVSDRLIVTYFLGYSFNGIYALANKFPSLFITLTNVFQISWSENAAETMNSEDRDQYYSKIMNQSLGLFSCCCAVIIAALPLAFKILVNESYNDAYYHILILLISALFHTVGNLYGSLFGALKHTKYIAKTTVFSAIANLVINLSLIHFIGLYAASISTMVAYLLIAVMRHKEICKIIKIKYQFKTVILSILSIIISSISFAVNNTLLTIAAIAATALLTIFLNKDMVNKIITNLKAKFTRKKI